MQHFLRNYFIALLLLAFVAGIPALYLYRSGEYMSLDEVVVKQGQLSSVSVYGTALHVNTHIYKQALLSHAQPDIITLGSSRVMQFREYMFAKPFLNLGGGMTSVNEGVNLIQDIVDKEPEVVILGLDIWWFNERYQKPNINAWVDDDLTPDPSPYHVFSVVKWLFEGKIAVNEFIQTIIQGPPSGNIGVAGQKQDGFGGDGSYYYTRLITGKFQSLDKNFKDTFNRIEKGNNRFQYGSIANDQHVSKLLKLIKTLGEQQIKVLVFFPPFSNAVNDRLYEMRENYQYINDLKSKLSENGVPFHDYSNPESIDSDDCEFIDGFHGGNVTYGRILEDLVSENLFLGDYVDQHRLRNLIDENKGKAFIHEDTLTEVKETDFLELGCKKA